MTFLMLSSEVLQGTRVIFTKNYLIFEAQGKRRKGNASVFLPLSIENVVMCWHGVFREKRDGIVVHQREAR